MSDEKVVRKKRSWLPVLVIIGVIFLGIIFVLTSMRIKSSNNERKLQEKLDLGEKYLSELDYEQAIVAYEAAIEIDPMSAEAYLGLADVYIAMGDVENALVCLQQGYDATGEARILDRINEVTTLQEQELSQENVELSESEDMDWLTNGVPKDTILNVGDFKLDGVYIADLTPSMLLERYGEYDNSYTVDDFKHDNSYLYDELNQNMEYVNAYEQGNWDAVWTIEETFWNDKVSESGLYKKESAYYDVHTYENTELTDESYIMTRGDSPTAYWQFQSIVNNDGWQEITLSGQNVPIGFGDIYFGDDFSTVMTKFGFSTHQAEWVQDKLHNNDSLDSMDSYNAWYGRDKYGNGMIVFDEVQFSIVSAGGTYYINFKPYDGGKDLFFIFDENYKLISCRSFGHY